ncbi:AAA family ATPase [Sphingobium bisphenolivorans]|uniref:AAA family ATPase n=1 Tax=Sphingobium bisphenolivorans TaxID=1335760 RepID=UPI0003A9DC93|nr:ATP-binding protein [Sphingobium bisphenolivorans]
MSFLSIIGRWLRPRRKRAQSGNLSQRLAEVRVRSGSPDQREAPVTSAAQVHPLVQADLARSAIRKGFNSTQPVTSARHLQGRQEELEQLVDGVLDRCNHAMIYGPRGSGKTSLARVFANMADDRGLIVLYSACEPDQSLHQLISPYLAATLPADRQHEVAAGPPLATREMVDLLAAHVGRRFIFILDEFDRVTNVTVQHELARMMKMLSDAAIPVNIVAVGIGSSVAAMIEGHASLRRHMIPVAVAGIESDAVVALIDRGAAATGLPFTDAAREMIALLSCGSPYHVRLFCALASLEALRRQHRTVEVGAAVAGISRAVNDWSRTNAGQAALFRKAVALGPAHWDLIEHVARDAAIHGSVPFSDVQKEHGAMLEPLILLRDALEPANESGDRFAFHDSLAPQFLLAMLFATRNSDKADHKIVNFVDPMRQPMVH